MLTRDVRAPWALTHLAGPLACLHWRAGTAHYTGPQQGPKRVREVTDTFAICICEDTDLRELLSLLHAPPKFAAVSLSDVLQGQKNGKKLFFLI